MHTRKIILLLNLVADYFSRCIALRRGLLLLHTRLAPAVTGFSGRSS